MEETPQERIARARRRVRDARQTIEVLERLRPENRPTREDLIALHELHALHERAQGREHTAAAADERAENARRLRF